MGTVYNRDSLDDSDFAIVLFDGVCNFCNSSVNFLIDHDLRRRLRFGSLQSEVGHRIMKDYGISSDFVDSIVLIDNRKAYFRSEAILRIAQKLGGLWKLFYPLIFIPPSLRDSVYDWVASNRYRWFGKSRICRVPTPELRERFIV